MVKLFDQLVDSFLFNLITEAFFVLPEFVVILWCPNFLIPS